MLFACVRTLVTLLHLIEPLGFDLDDKKLRRAGLDYHEFAHINRYKNWEDFLAKNKGQIGTIYALTTKGSHTSQRSHRLNPMTYWYLDQKPADLP